MANKSQDYKITNLKGSKFDKCQIFTASSGRVRFDPINDTLGLNLPEKGYYLIPCWLECPGGINGYCIKPPYKLRKCNMAKFYVRKNFRIKGKGE